MPIYKPGKLPKTGITWVDALLRAMHEEPDVGPTPMGYFKVPAKGLGSSTFRRALEHSIGKYGFRSKGNIRGGFQPVFRGSHLRSVESVVKKGAPRYKATIPPGTDFAPHGKLLHERTKEVLKPATGKQRAKEMSDYLDTLFESLEPDLYRRGREMGLE